MRTVPRVIVTDRLRSHRAAHRQVIPSVEHRQSKHLNNRAENSHQPTWQRDRAMKGFRSAGGAQRFLAASSGTSPHFRPRRHLMTASGHRAETTLRFARTIDPGTPLPVAVHLFHPSRDDVANGILHNLRVTEATRP